MKSLQDYIETYRNIASNLNIRGDSVELLVQLLANASYINEVENISYSQEASLEKATQMNSKIQHCIDNMYSVFRGLCPRVILNIKPLKPISFEPYEEIVSGNTFKLYYLGYYKDETIESKSLKYDTGISYCPLTFTPNPNPNSPDNITKKIMCLLTKERDGVIDKSWVLNENNTYYVDCIEEDLSNDLVFKIGDEIKTVTTEFSEHILNSKVFDLTLPAFGSRFYISGTYSDKDTTNTKLSAKIFKYSTLSSYNESDLKKINIKGVDLIKASSDDVFWTSRGLVEFFPGVYLIEETKRDSLVTTHYFANKSRYTNTIIRSNSDLGDLLYRTFPSDIEEGGTKSIYNDGIIELFYIPKDTSKLLDYSQIESFIEGKKSYYVSNEIKIESGKEYTASFNIEVELYQSNSVDTEILNILNKYELRFDTNFLSKDEKNIAPNLYSFSKLGEIETLISKIPNVKKLNNISISYYQNEQLIQTYINKNEISIEFSEMLDDLARGGYYKINCDIKSII